MKIKFAGNLKFLRKKFRISQEGLAHQLDISRNKIASYESRNIEPKLGLLSSIAQYFKISVDDLIKTELNDSNIDVLLDKNQSMSQLREDEGILIEFKPDKKEAIQNFIKKNEKIHKVVEGFKAYHIIVDQLEYLHNKQLLNSIEYLLDANRSLIHEINQ